MLESSQISSASRNPNCELCPLHAGARTVCLWGDGPRDARVVIVGQNPGVQEDANGKPFIGAQGQLLSQLLQDAGLDRPSDVYVTNAVKCLTPSNREPSKAEAKKCKPYLESELASLRPKIIITLGNTALQAVTGQTGVSKKRGQFFEHNGVPVIATYHPAYALRSPQYLNELRADIQRAATFVNPPAHEKIRWEWGQREHDPHNYDAPIWSFDIETNSLEYASPNFQIYMLGIDDGTRRVVYAGETLRVGFERLAKAYLQKKVRLFGHNSIAFDAEALYRKFGVYLTVDDTLVLAHILDENAPLSLEAQACTQLGVPNWKQQVDWDWASMTPDEMQRCAQYNAEDIAYTRALATKLVLKAREQGVDRAYEITRLGTIVFEHHVNHQGIAINLPGLRTLRDELRTNALDASLKFEQIVGHPVNLGSPKQVANVLFNELGLTPVRFTETGQASTDEYSLKTILLSESFGGPQDGPAQALNALLASRENEKLASMLDAFENKTSPDGRLYFHTFTCRTTTGRTTADQGFQQFPHDPRVRGLLTAAPGNVLIEADYAQLQMRLAAEIFDSNPLRTLFREGIDPHTFMASRITGKRMEEVTKEERYVAKPANFGLLFGGDEYTLRRLALLDYGLVLPRTEAKRIHNVFHESYQLERGYDRIVAELKANGCVRDPLGGIRHLPNIYAATPAMQMEAIRQAINYPVQRLEVYLAFLALWELFTRGLKIVGFLHDAVYIECREDQADHVKRQLREVMVEKVPEVLSSRYDLRLAIPLDIDVKVKAGI